MDGVRSRGGSVYCIGIGGVMMASGDPRPRGQASLSAVRIALCGRMRQSDGTAPDGSRHPAVRRPRRRPSAARLRCGDLHRRHRGGQPGVPGGGGRGIPRFSRADYIGWLMTGYSRRVGVAGMHGKSTCTSMCAQVFRMQPPTRRC